MKGKRILSAVLSAALLLQLSPLVAFAEDTTPLPDTISTVQSEPAPELLAEPTPEPTVEPATALPPEPEAEPTATPTPNPTAEPTATPAAETPAPDATAEPTPEPTVEPTATPDAAEQVQALIDALPDADAVTADTADEVEEQLTAIDDAKATLTDEQLGGLDFARYDAAANALLALRGEAPTDAVEMLDTIYTAPDIVDGWYVIDDENDLYWLATTAPKDVKAKLTENITVNSSVLDTSGNPNSASFKAWTPITDFAGTLDGQGHTISGLYCDKTNSKDSNYVGLFGSISGGMVTHLGVVDSYFAGGSFVGGVCGYNKGTISGCYSTATVNSTASGGVMVGYSAGKVENSFAYGHAQGKASPFSVSDAASGEGNCFYLSLQKDTSILGKTGATVDQFKSGEVAYQLSNGGSSKEPIWKQVLNKDPYPSFEGQAVGKADNGTYHNHENAGNCPVCGNVGKPGNDGNGSYLITTEEEFKWFAAQVNIAQNSSAKAVLANDITVTSWTPIGNATNKFNGTLDGNGHTVTIDSMANNSADYAGLVGYLGNFGTVRNIKVAGKVSGGNNVGGVVGYCLGELQNVMNAATVRGTSNVGGVVGYMGSTKSSYNLGNTGEITGSSVGGLVGTMAGGGYVNNGFSTTQGVCGTLQSGTFNNCYDTTMKNLPAFESGEVAYLLHQPSSGSTWGQNLDGVDGKAKETAPNCLNNSPQVFQNKDKDGYHNHTGETCDKCPTVPPQENGVYQISTEQQLRDYARIVNTENRTASAVLKADITVSGEWTPIGGSDVYFQGTFDGQNYSITFKQPVTSTSNYVGLFARTESGAKIQKLTVQGKFSSGNTVGGIVGLNKGTITNCKLQNSTVTNTGSNTAARTGGLVGENYGTIQNSQVVDSTVTGVGGYTGGLVGTNYQGTIQNSQVVGSTVTGSTVSTNADNGTGGLAGYNYNGTIQNCRVINSTVDNTGNAGGLVGVNLETNAVIRNSYAVVDLPVAGLEKNSAKTINCYRLGNGKTDPTVATPDQFKNGEIAYKLAGGYTAWGQTIHTDAYPVLDGAKVYCEEGYYHNHNGSCALCDGNKPNKNEKGAYVITSYTDLLWFAKLVNGTLLDGMPAKPTVNAVLNAENADITVQSDWPGIGTDKNAYGGTFNGNSHTVTLTSNGGNTQQLFVKTSNKANLNAICVKGGYLSHTDSAIVNNCYRQENAPLFYEKAAGSAKNCYTLGKLAEQAGSATFTNCYAVTATGNTTITSVGLDAFKSGQVAYNLAKYDPNWGQTLDGTTTYPVYGGKAVYFNSTSQYHNHQDGKVCETCNSEPAKDNNGWYMIRNAAELKWFANWVNGVQVTDETHPKANAKLAENITLNASVLNENGELNSGNIKFEDWTPIQGFNGTFDGKGYTIRGLYVNDSNKEYVGLFSTVESDGKIQNVNIADSYVCGRNSVGLLCGKNSGGNISGCTVSGKVNGTGSYIGGVCGNNTSGKVSGCDNTATVTGNESVGGVCGYNTSGTVSGCDNTATVTGNESVGGVCGNNTSGKVSDCDNTATVTGNKSVGGVCGKSENNSTIENSHNTEATVEGDQNVGGICGENNNSSITGCTVSGSVKSASTSFAYVGGVCGFNNSGKVENCYNTAAVIGTGTTVGGVCGKNYSANAEITNCTNAGTVSGKTNIGGVCGLNYQGSVQTSSNAGEVKGTGGGSAYSAYSGVGGVCGFNNSGKVNSCHNTFAVTGKGRNVGGVCGSNYRGTVQTSSNTGAVTGEDIYVGGVCGYNHNNSEITDSYSTGNVTGENTVGGICGNSNMSNITGSYSTGNVTGENTVGGICGYVGTNVTFSDCYYLAQDGTSEPFGYTETNLTATSCESKTAVEFRIGAVAFLLQQAADKATSSTETAETWGQTLGKNPSPVLQWQTDDYKKVYKKAASSLCKGYSNTPNDTSGHSYKNGACIHCGKEQPIQVAYTVTIPANVELGKTATITAKGVTLPDGKKLNVKVDKDSKFTVALDGDTVEYTVKNGETTVRPGDTVLTVSQSTDSASTDLTFSTPSSTTYSGTYQGTVTFTVSVDDKQAS